MSSKRVQIKAQKWQWLTKVLSVSVFVTSHSALAFGFGEPINDRVISKLASTDALKVSKSRVIIDNDEAFRQKLAYVKNAKAGETIDMIYYIYATDYSSSVLSDELINAAQRGVKVRLLVDYLTNYKNIDAFLMLEDRGTTSRGDKNIEIRLFGKPSQKIKEDAVFLTTSCASGMDGCISAKKQKAAALTTNGNGTDYLSRLFLTGLFAKNANALKLSVIEGQAIDFDQFKGDESLSEEDLNDLKKLGSLIFKAKVKGELKAKFQLFMALSLYGDKVMPIYNLVTTSLPLSSEDDSAKEWTYLSDYTHHKMMLVSKKSSAEFILGGRNIEDSYHVKINDMATDAKYIFMDTELSTDLSADSAKQVKTRFESLWNFKVRVADLTEVDATTEIDSLSSIGSVVEAITVCKADNKALTSNCVESKIDSVLAKNGVIRSARLQAQYNQMIANRDVYNSSHRTDSKMIDTWTGIVGNDSLSAQDMASAEFYYIENLPFAKNNESVRQFGSNVMNPAKSNKNITDLVLRGLEQTCRSSSAQNPKSVILHNAYFFPAPVIVRAFGNMINGAWPCQNVKMTIITNSYETTDLFPVNAVASMQVKALFDAAQVLKKTDKRAAKNMAQVEYVEYRKSSEQDARSLHTKIAIMGDDVILGSANLDIRSYSMDTNNGVFIRGAKDFAKSYTQYINKLLAGQVSNADGSSRFATLNRTAELKETKTAEAYRDENIEIFKYVSAKYKTSQKVFASEDFMQWLNVTMDFIYASTLSGLDVDLTIPSDRSLKLWGESCEARKSQKAMCKESRKKDQKLRRLKWEDQLQSLFETI